MDGATAIALPGAAIPARSERQAMDWSLALASQDIHPVILPPDEARGWLLLVDPSEYERAARTLALYRAENRGWAWRNELPGSNLEIHSGAVGWCILLGFWHWVVSHISPMLATQGKMDSAAVLAGAWYRLFTPILLHADLAHLMANVTFGTIILGLAMARFGPGLALLSAFLAGALGNAAGVALYAAPYTGVGASGMMMGALGLLGAHSAGLWRRSRRAARYILSGVLAGFLLFVIFGLNPNSDVLAHLGGFVSGLGAGALLSLCDEKKLGSNRVTIASLGILLALLAVTWGLALR